MMTANNSPVVSILRIPEQADHDSGLKPIRVPG
jgi:hypothetical protein